MIREIKKNRELLKFSEFIYGLECLYTMQYTSFFNKGDLVFIYSIEHITNKLTVHKLEK